MKHSLFCFLVLSTCLQLDAEAQQKLSIDSFIGVWKGTSLCQVKSSPCHDEVVVYYITKTPGRDSCRIEAFKIVNGVEEDMGPLPCRFDSEKGSLVSSAYKGHWTFTIKNGKMSGVLYARNALFRKMELTKAG